MANYIIDILTNEREDSAVAAEVAARGGTVEEFFTEVVLTRVANVAAERRQIELSEITAALGRAGNSDIAKVKEILQVVDTKQ